MNYDDELLPSVSKQETSQNGGYGMPYNGAPNMTNPNGGFGKGLLIGVLVTLVISTLSAGIGALVLIRAKQDNSSVSVTNEKTDDKVDKITDMIDEYYYEDVEEGDLQEGIYKGVVEGLDDPYSEYYTAEEYEEYIVDTTGNYAGIGATLNKDEDTGAVKVIKVFDNCPADKAGLKKGDIIISADGIEGKSMELDEFVSHIRGSAGTSVQIVYSRDDKENTISINREEITIPSVSYKMLGDGVALIEISGFYTGTEKEFENAVEALKAEGMQSIIFDLRDNPGGLVDSVTEILDDILPEGTTVYMEDKNGERTTYTSEGNSYMDYPMVVLTSENTASAAEIFAGAIRDFEYGTLVGEKTYGKGVVQSTFPMRDGSAVKLTIARYFTPSGECIHEKGIDPDVEIEYEYTGDENADEYDYGADNQVQKAIEILKGGA